MTASPTTPALGKPALAVADLLSPAEGASTVELAQRAGIARSTAQKALVALAEAGRALRVPGTAHGQPDAWFAADSRARSADHGTEESEAAAETDQTAPNATAPVADQPQEADSAGRRKAQEPKATRRASAKDAGLTAPPVPAGRLAKGQLGPIVLQAFALNPDETFTGSRMGKLLGKSPGAVTNCMEKLAAHNAITQVSEDPVTYSGR